MYGRILKFNFALRLNRLRVKNLKTGPRLEREKNAIIPVIYFCVIFFKNSSEFQ